MSAASSPVLQRLLERFPGAIAATHSYRGDDTAVVRRERLIEVCRFLKQDPELRFQVLMDLAGVDALRLDLPHRFEVVYHLYSLTHNHRVRLKVPVGENDLTVDSAIPIWPAANWFEREVYDMFGVRFNNHPNLKRILMYDHFVGHPLRKDYPVDRRQPLIGPGAVAELSPQELALSTPADGEPMLSTVDTLSRFTDPDTGRTTEHLLLNVGPSHPAMHGVIRILVELEGETVVRSDIEIGYLHRAFEKQAEAATWNQVFPYSDRLNYVSPFINNFGYALAAERLLGVEVPERCQYIRVLMSEISRVTDHLTCIGATAMELGAMTAFLYFMQAREYLYELVEAVSGARITVSFSRVGGLKADLPEGFAEQATAAFAKVRHLIKECDILLTKNRIFVDRTRGIGPITQRQAIDYGVTGPLLRATGIEYDVRKATPYCVYDRMSFEIPTASHGDVYDRYLVRMAEMEQSLRICEQALRDMPPGPVAVDSRGKPLTPDVMVDRAKMGEVADLSDAALQLPPDLEGIERPHHLAVQVQDRRVTLPSKEDMYGNIEGLMQHFMLVMDGAGIKPPPGEVYQAVEGANGELGFYVISDGTGCPYRVRVRPPCFALMQAFPLMIEGQMVADIIASFGSINMIAGELDR